MIKKMTKVQKEKAIDYYETEKRHCESMAKMYYNNVRICVNAKQDKNIIASYKADAEHYARWFVHATSMLNELQGKA